jgi:hypothetical protein
MRDLDRWTIDRPFSCSAYNSGQMTPGDSQIEEHKLAGIFAIRGKAFQENCSKHLHSKYPLRAHTKIQCNRATSRSYFLPFQIAPLCDLKFLLSRFTPFLTSSDVVRQRSTCCASDLPSEIFELNQGTVDLYPAGSSRDISI